ncbi:hypothetical protein M409DRAFT_69578 [Zasmidium cellare ATCC 36951]|uniref:Nucleolar protein 12 n=1 Tax=Zasmidium cellare ATCC 36951 TaxID=1080233 RepID=A0A6A6C3Q7_ZASCE|nr:uncharacterized protein M409DRAFT_69578 [Zasmidium cellare ATCC 36951]KAF2161777.1 hypothetical protein M409DRAFT_69578 [Zasmidium cellare ATCC 36951]
MSKRSGKESKSGDGKVKKSKKGDKHAKIPEDQKQRAAESAFSVLVTDDKTVNPSLSSLFAVKQPPVKAKPASAPKPRTTKRESSDEAEDEDNDAELSELDEDEVWSALDESESNAEEEQAKEVAIEDEEDSVQPKRKRKKKDADVQLEDAYMSKLAREEERDAERMAAERAAKRQKAADLKDDDEDENEGESGKMDEDEDEVEDDDDDEATLPPPKHETEQQADDDLAKANRTVFLGNVSTAAISSKSSRKVFENHLKSFFDDLPASKDGIKHKLESIRFRSTPYASAIPKKASYAKKEIMDATTKSSNAYAVYSSPLLAREAAKRLNGTIILDRHLRVDEVAHPSKVDHHRCIFVGNLGFVDDESNIQDANEEDGREKRKRGKEPSDIEEGLWRTFMKCGAVESVRVIRDSTTRVGKGIAYVQFEDENALEAALLYNEKKFPPMLPRKLRVSRAKAQKRNVKPGSDRPSTSKQNPNGYQRKLTGQEASNLGRTSKLLGRAAAAKARKPEKKPAASRDSKPAVGGEIKGPESFIFEGHRATEKQGKSGLKLGGRHTKNKTKVTKRSSSFKKSGKKTA